MIKIETLASRFGCLKDYPVIVIIATLMVVNTLMSSNLKVFSDFTLFYIKTGYFLRYVCLVLFLFYFFITKGNKKQFYTFVAFIILDWLLKKLANTHVLFELLFIPLCLAQFVNRTRLFKILFYLELITLIIVVTLHFADLIPAETFFRDDKIRYTLGFCHPNSLGFYILYLTILYTLYKDSFNYPFIAVVIALFFFCYFVPRSMTSAFLLLLIAAGIFCIYFVKRTRIFLDRISSKIFYIVAIAFLIMLFLIYFVSATGFGKELLLKMPGAIWARFELGMIGYHKYGLSLFGTPVEMIFPDPSKNIYEFFVVDCSYFFMPLNYGIVIYTFFILFILLTIYLTAKQKDYKYLMILLLVLLYGISEQLPVLPIIVPIYAYIYCKKNNPE